MQGRPPSPQWSNEWPHGAEPLRSSSHASPAAARPLPLRRPRRHLSRLTSAQLAALPVPVHTSSRRRAPRIVAGVCAGVAAHLGLSVTLVRFLAVAAAFCGGSGVLLYILLWIAVPVGDPWAEAAGAAPPSRARLAGRPTELISMSGRLRSILGGGALLLAAVLLELWREGLLSSVSWVGPLIVTGGGTALVWSQVDAVTKPGHGIGARVRMTGGVALAAVGILMWMSRDTAPGALLAGSLTSIALIVGIGLILTPLWLRTNRALAETRAAEVREAERADIAAHLHDSVLQTLTLIRKRADEPATVARLARSQERELRAWLYTDRPEAGRGPLRRGRRAGGRGRPSPGPRHRGHRRRCARGSVQRRAPRRPAGVRLRRAQRQADGGLRARSRPRLRSRYDRLRPPRRARVHHRPQGSPRR